MDNYSSELELRIDWSEIDPFGHVNNIAIIKYVQAARVKYMDESGILKSYKNIEKGPILASINLQFKKQLFFPGAVKIFSKVTEIKNTSFIIRHQIYDENNELAAEAEDVIVYFDFIRNTKLPLTDQIRKQIASMETVL